MTDDPRRGRKPRQTPLARRRRWFALEAKLQLDLFLDCEAQAAKARAELDALQAAPIEEEAGTLK
jgi:hypothetical protein